MILQFRAATDINGTVGTRNENTKTRKGETMKTTYCLQYKSAGIWWTKSKAYNRSVLLTEAGIMSDLHPGVFETRIVPESQIAAESLAFDDHT